jgi:hypothetical protein
MHTNKQKWKLQKLIWRKSTQWNEEDETQKSEEMQRQPDT